MECVQSPYQQGVLSVKAIAVQRYGGPEVLELMDLPEPRLGPDVVLVRVKYAGVNPADWKIREGYIDDWFESHFPLVMGCDMAGVVERTGLGVTEFSPGDEVVGYVRADHMQRGTYGAGRRARADPGAQAASSRLAPVGWTAGRRTHRLPGTAPPSGDRRR